MRRTLVVTLFALCTLSGCGEGTVTSAHFVNSETRVDVEYGLVGAHPYLAEFHRTFRVTFAGSSRELPLEMDTGGYLLMNVYRLPEHRLLFYDGADYVIIDCDRGSIEQARAAPAVSAEYLGCFDWPRGSTLEFIAAATRAERRPLPRNANASTKTI